MHRRRPFALVKTEIKMYLSLIKCIHVACFALWVGPRFTNHLWPRDLNGPRVGHQTQPLVWPLIALEGTFDQTGLFKISISSMDRVISATKWSDTISVEANKSLIQVADLRRSWTLIVQVVKCLSWPFQLSTGESRPHDEKAQMEIASQLVWCRWKNLKCYDLSCSSDGWKLPSRKLLNVIW